MPHPATGRSLVWLTLMAGCAFLILVGLGLWQLARLDWKNELAATATARLEQAAGPLPADFTDIDALNFRHVTGSAQLIGETVLYRTGGSPTGRAGLRVLAPASFEGQAAPILLDLGWIPLDRKNDAIALPDSPIIVDGVLLAPEPSNWLTPDNNPATNSWKWLDLPAMAQALAVPALAPMLLRAERITAADGTPLPDETLERGPVTLELRNDHLQYALTWFTLAAAMAVIYVMLVRRNRRKKDKPTP